MPDFILTVGSLIFAIALIPSVRGTDKPAAWSSFMTGSVLGVYSMTFLSIGLYYSAITTALTSMLWFTLLIQKMRERHAVG